jgi:2-oxoglutarate ferredoxin oxidoreductase subunit delta
MERVQKNERFDAYVVGKRQNRVFVVDRDRCKGCRLCTSICPYDALYMSKDKTYRGFIYPIENGKCTACKQCLYICPDFVLSVYSVDEVKK